MPEAKSIPLAPVAFFVFNRPIPTARVFAQIRKARPAKLLLVADGPRATHPDDAERCRAVRQILAGVDWPCEMAMNFAEKNLGCYQRVSSGLDWVFSQVEEAIILEDDCLPSDSFFSFCSELLERYRDDARVMHIGGSNFQNGIKHSPYSYYSSRLSHIWGWATWRRAWSEYDGEMQEWPEFSLSKRLHHIVQQDRRALQFWTDFFSTVYRKQMNTWDVQWLFTLWQSDGVALLPQVNMVTNIGAGMDATHTFNGHASLSIPASDIWQILHPPSLEFCEAADRYTFEHHYCGVGRQQTLRKLLGKQLRSVLKYFVFHEQKANS